MNPRAVNVAAKDDYVLQVKFSNGEARLFDMKPYLNHGIFSELTSLDYFRRAKIFAGTVVWPHEQDICPDTLYEESIPLVTTIPS